MATYVSQGYVTAVGLLVMPGYLRYLGAEAYGLVGFFTSLQFWFNLLDVGLSPTVARETARLRAGALDALTYRRLLRALQWLFTLVGGTTAAALATFAHRIASSWLHVRELSILEVQHSIQLMAIAVAFRWLAGLYRACIVGNEKLVWLAGINSLIATLRFVIPLPLMAFFAVGPVEFFTYQVAVGGAELSLCFGAARVLLPKLPTRTRVGWSLKPIVRTLGFSGSIAFTSSVWILVTQSDRLTLSGLLSLDDFGYFTLAVLAAGGVTMISSPITSALLPRLAVMEAEDKGQDLLTTYQHATQAIAIVALSLSFLLASLPVAVLWVWTGNAVMVERMSVTLSLYALGNGFATLSAFAYYLQYAKGDLRFHVLANIAFVAVYAPMLLACAVNFASVGAGAAWLVANVVLFCVYVPLVHRRFAPGLHARWLVAIVRAALPPAVISLGAAAVISQHGGRRGLLVVLLLVYAASLVSAAAASSWARRGLLNSFAAVRGSLPTAASALQNLSQSGGRQTGDGIWRRPDMRGNNQATHDPRK